LGQSKSDVSGQYWYWQEKSRFKHSNPMSQTIAHIITSNTRTNQRTHVGSLIFSYEDLSKCRLCDVGLIKNVRASCVESAGKKVSQKKLSMDFTWVDKKLLC
jgi:hypothetical protein